jgi:glycosyltransferase involved in cell wall biosynthesis
MISVTILTKDCAKTLPVTLDSVQHFSEVLVFDTGSQDKTLEIAASYPNVKVISGEFTGFGKAHNLASSLARYDWILSIDSDEVLSPPLLQEIQQLDLNPACAYRILRKNYYNDKWIRWCGGWHPDWVVRLYHRQKTRFTDAAVHEKVITERLEVVSLHSPLLHTPYRKISDFLSKMQTYSTLFAEQNKGKKQSSLCQAIFHSWFAFFKSYILKRGFLGGKEGFIISLYNGHTAFYKYLKLAEEIQK